jgi:hypothetical protein
MRWILLLSLVLVGCVATVPDDPTISADLAVETARAVLAARKPPPAPAPAPGGRCQNCDGRGYVGDGTIRVKCQPCNGTGKTKCANGVCEP